MMLLSSPHTHTQFCDGRDTARAMAESAVAHGFVSLGFSGHAKQYFDPECAMDDLRERAYIAQVRALQKAYAGRLRIWLGTERDAYAYADRAPYDYVIGSVHYLPDKNGFVAVDGGREALCTLRDDAYAGDGLALARAYYAELSAYARAYRPEICGHFDLIRKNNRNNALFDEAAPEYRRIALDALEGVRASGAVLEVNTGGMARYGAEVPYPARFILQSWREMGGEVMLSSDCHFARDIAAGYDQARALLRDVGFESALVLGRGDALFERTEL